MTESWGVALVVLAAVLLGAAIPVLVQLRTTLRAMEKALQRSGARLDEALGATTTAAGRIDRWEQAPIFSNPERLTSLTHTGHPVAKGDEALLKNANGVGIGKICNDHRICMVIFEAGRDAGPPMARLFIQNK